MAWKFYGRKFPISMQKHFLFSCMKMIFPCMKMKISPLVWFLCPREVHGWMSCTRLHEWNFHPWRVWGKIFIFMHAKIIFMDENEIFMHEIFVGHLIPALNSKASQAYIHNRTPDINPVPRLALFLDMLSVGVCTTSHWQTSGRLEQEWNVCTLRRLCQLWLHDYHLKRFSLWQIFV